MKFDFSGNSTQIKMSLGCSSMEFAEKEPFSPQTSSFLGGQLLPGQPGDLGPPVCSDWKNLIRQLLPCPTDLRKWNPGRREIASSSPPRFLPTFVFPRLKFQLHWNKSCLAVCLDVDYVRKPCIVKTQQWHKMALWQGHPTTW